MSRVDRLRCERRRRIPQIGYQESRLTGHRSASPRRKSVGADSPRTVGYNRLVITDSWRKRADISRADHHGRPSKPRVAGSNPAGRASFRKNSPIVVPPSKTARVSRRRPRSRARDRTITDVRTLGRRRWKKEAGYQLQARVENAFFRYTSIIGDRLRARSRGGRVAESVVACNVLNQMTELGRPESYSIGR